ncbi:hypothetical protein MKEN_01240700 [Mycena kentingensis (nom. inval.)]|nr:hypothetical protein MKEN_01240700 [Mycena kentingensis (nom. inval.)]
MGSQAHPELHELKGRLEVVHEALAHFRPLILSPPILDSCVEADDAPWVQNEGVPGVKKLRESLKYDIDMLDKFLSNPKSDHEPPISTHAPYLLAVYNEIIYAPPPVVSVFKFVVEGGAAEGNPPGTVKKKKERTAVKRHPPSTKVDVVAENGKRWIRINTIKMTGILAELREIDSYLTDSEDDDDGDVGPSLAQKEFDNSILQMGRGLVEAAKLHPVNGQPPHVTMRLTRIDVAPEREDGTPNDPRIAQTINLDLSVLVALVSDLTHSPVPTSVEEANTRFLPPQQYRDWRPQNGDTNVQTAAEPTPDVVRHSRALTLHVLQEMRRGLLQEIHDRLPAGEKVEFWTSEEARERCLRIVSRIGGPREIRRAEALFSAKEENEVEVGAAETEFWAESRYPKGFLAIFPIRMYPAPVPEVPPGRFFRALTSVCQRLLVEEEEVSAKAASSSSRLSPHAIKSMLRGSELGWTTLTTTKSSVKALLREVKYATLDGRLAEFDLHAVGDEEQDRKAALWIVDARNLQCFL